MITRKPRLCKCSAGLFQGISIALLLIFCALCIYPFLYIIILSLNDAQDAARGGIYLFPRQFSLANYEAVFKNATILLAYGVTILRVLLNVVLQIFLCSMFAYGISKRQFKLQKFLNWMIIIPMYFTAGLIPTYLLYSKLNLLNHFAVYILPVLYNSFHILLMRTSIREIPDALEESARLDGANDGIVFFRIILPLMKPVLATVALFIGVGAWNDWYVGFTFITNENLWSIQNVLLYIIQSNEASNLARIAKMRQGMGVTVTAESVKMAMIVLTTLPILCIYPFVQKYFVKGVMIGSLKG